MTDKNTETIELILRFISRMFIAGGAVAAFVVIISGGDGYYNDGDLKTMGIAMLTCVACTVSVKIINAIIDKITETDKIDINQSDDYFDNYFKNS